MSYIVGGVPIKRLLYHAALTGVSGVTIGTCYRNLREHPGTGRKIMGYSVAGGGMGALFGVAMSTFRGRHTVLLVMTQTMYWSLTTAFFFNVRSVLSNRKIVLPGQNEPVKDIFLTSTTAGLTASLTSLITGPNPVALLSACSIGMMLGFVGHHLYDQSRILRLEFLLRQNYPELMLQKQEAEAYMEDQVLTNQFYDGPIKPPHPWIEYLSSLSPQGYGNQKKIQDALNAEGMS